MADQSMECLARHLAPHSALEHNFANLSSFAAVWRKSVRCVQVEQLRCDLRVSHVLDRMVLIEIRRKTQVVQKQKNTTSIFLE